MRNCFDEGNLQAWFDGELSSTEAANVAAHLSACAQCAEAVRIIEAENLIVAEGLTAEFSAAVPTDRLRARLNIAVAAMENPRVPAASQSSWRAAFESLFSIRSLAYAAVVIAVLFAGVFGFVYFNRENAPAIIAAQTVPSLGLPINTERISLEETPAAPAKKFERMPAVAARSKQQPSLPEAMSLAWQESQYTSAIATLNEAIKIQEPLRPALRVEYEYKMAVINDTIATTRDVARRKPNDPQAAQVVLTAYQSKLDLLNEIANPVQEK